jgi:hypothetical protein
MVLSKSFQKFPFKSPSVHPARDNDITSRRLTILFFLDFFFIFYLFICSVSIIDPLTVNPNPADFLAYFVQLEKPPKWAAKPQAK